MRTNLKKNHLLFRMMMMKNRKRNWQYQRRNLVKYLISSSKKLISSLMIR